jgi:hypothetical protein
MSVDGACQKLGEEAAVRGRKLLIVPLQSRSMEVMRPFSKGVELGSLGGVPNVVQEGLEDWLGGGVQIKRGTTGAHPSGGSADLQPVGQHALTTPVKEAVRAIRRVVQPTTDEEEFLCCQPVREDVPVGCIRTKEPDFACEPLNKAGTIEVHGIGPRASEDSGHGVREPR